MFDATEIPRNDTKRSFDPENVERLYPDINGNMKPVDTPGIDYVSGEDYDQLLELYRALLLTFGPEGSLGYMAAVSGQRAEVRQIASPNGYLVTLEEAARKY